MNFIPSLFSYLDLQLVNLFVYHIGKRYYLLVGIAGASREEETFGGLSAFRNLGKSTKDGVLGTASAPIHTITNERTHFKEQLWSTIRTIAVGFLLISGIGALIEDRGIGKGNLIVLYSVMQ